MTLKFGAVFSLFAFLAGGAGLGQAASFYDTTVLANNPVTFFPLNEVSGSTANNDSKAAGAQNGAYNAVTLGITGSPDAAGGAYNGHSSNVSVTNYPALDVAQDFSIEAWVKTANATDNPLGTIFAINRGANGTGLAFDLTGNTPLLAINNNTVNFNTTATGAVASGTWNQVDVTYNGSAVDFYIDGKAAGSTPFSQMLSLSTTLPLTLGVEFPDNFLGGRYFTGDIADVSFFNAALTGNQVQNDYAAAVPEPASLLMLGGGLLVLGGLRRRAKTKLGKR